MESLDHDPIILTGRTRDHRLPISIKHQNFARFSIDNNHNPQESTNNNSDYNSRDITRRDEFVIHINDSNPPLVTPNPYDVPQIHNQHGILYLVYAGAIVVMYPSLGQLAQLKFQGTESPFASHGFLTKTSVVAYIIAIPASILLFYMKAHLESMIQERSSPTYYLYVILKSVFCFSGILSPLSLVLVLLNSHWLNWIGYSFMLAIFVTIVVCNFIDYRELLCKKDSASNLEAVQRDNSLGAVQRDDVSETESDMESVVLPSQSL